MYINKQDIINFNIRISSLDLDKQFKLTAVLSDRYTHGFPKKEMFTKFKYKYTEGIRPENLPYLDEFNYYYYTKPEISEKTQNNIEELTKLYELTKSIDSNTFDNHINTVIAIGKIAKFKDNLYKEIEKNIVINKKDELEKCLLSILTNYIEEEQIKLVINENMNLEIFDKLITIIYKKFPGLENMELKYKIVDLIKLAKWMVFAQEIKYLEDVEESNNFDSVMERVFRIYENKFIEDNVNLLEEYFENLNRVEENFLEFYKTVGLDRAIELVVSNIQNQDEKEIISNYLRDSASIEEPIQGMCASFDILENIFNIKN